MLELKSKPTGTLPYFNIPTGNHPDSGNPSPFWPPTNSSHVIEFKSKSHEDSDSSPPSPPLWGSTPTRPLIDSSPCSRSQAIAHGRREMMEMLKDMPESAYELSLRDLVDRRPVDVDRKVGSVGGSKMPENLKGSKRRDLRSGSFGDGGFLLKMFFPASLGGKKKNKKKKKSLSGSGRVSPVDKGVEGDWWRKRFSGAGEGDNSSKRSGSTSSSNSSSSRSRQTHGLLSGCWSFSFNKRKSNMERV